MSADQDAAFNRLRTRYGTHNPLEHLNAVTFRLWMSRYYAPGGPGENAPESDAAREKPAPTADDRLDALTQVDAARTLIDRHEGDLIDAALDEPGVTWDRVALALGYGGKNRTSAARARLARLKAGKGPAAHSRSASPANIRRPLLGDAQQQATAEEGQ